MKKKVMVVDLEKEKKNAKSNTLSSRVDNAAYKNKSIGLVGSKRQQGNEKKKEGGKDGEGREIMMGSGTLQNPYVSDPSSTSDYT